VLSLVVSSLATPGFAAVLGVDAFAMIALAMRKPL
jgi:hypothetical protein